MTDPGVNCVILTKFSQNIEYKADFGGFGMLLENTMNPG